MKKTMTFAELSSPVQDTNLILMAAVFELEQLVVHTPQLVALFWC
jgi:hypothetical protein